MNATSYGDAGADADVPAGARIPGPPHGGLIVLWIGWLLAAAVMVVIGGAVFVGILQAVSAPPP